jgi:hypothetical protein
MQTSLEETLRRFAPQVLGAIVRRFTANSHPAATIRHRSCAGDATRHAGGGKLRKTNGGAFRQLLMSTAGAGAG